VRLSAVDRLLTWPDHLCHKLFVFTSEAEFYNNNNNNNNNTCKGGRQSVCVIMYINVRK